MPFSVQNDAGTVADANAYIEVAYFESYCAETGFDLTGKTTQQKEYAIVKATRYLDSRFSYIGNKCTTNQTTQWPRVVYLYTELTPVQNIPIQVKQATAEYAKRALTADLMPDPTRDGTGKAVTEHSVSVGPIRETKKFLGSSYSWPSYPAADSLLLQSGFLVTGRRTVRG